MTAVSESQIMRLKQKAIQRSGLIYLPVACANWREAVTVQGGMVWLWYNTPNAEHEGQMDTRIVQEAVE